jgi:hypothetical protein
MQQDHLIGIGLYTPSEAARLLRLPPGKISRWLRGHQANDRFYPPLWAPQIKLDDNRVYLGFRDLMEIRVAAGFIYAGVSTQRVRAAIELARIDLGLHHPLSTDRFRTDGRNIFLRVVEPDVKGLSHERLLNLFKRQYEFSEIIEPTLRGIEFDEKGEPTQWWPRGRTGKIVLDPERAFGQPIDSESSVPTAILHAAGVTEGLTAAAKMYGVTKAAIRRATNFENALSPQ